ncbi:hypothetical protein YC2023_004596 [Brassica napus]
MDNIKLLPSVSKISSASQIHKKRNNIGVREARTHDLRITRNEDSCFYIDERSLETFLSKLSKGGSFILSNFTIVIRVYHVRCGLGMQNKYHISLNPLQQRVLYVLLDLFVYENSELPPPYTVDPSLRALNASNEVGKCVMLCKIVSIETTPKLTTVHPCQDDLDDDSPPLFHCTGCNGPLPVESL